MVRQPDTSPDEFIGEIVCAQSIPARIPLIAGDCLQNLRSTLDYLVWELVLAAKNQPTKDNMFPICTTPEAFNQQLARHRLDGVPIDARAEIEALQPYHGGDDPKGDVLAMLDEICNINKHRRVLTTIFRGSKAPSDFITKELDGHTYASVNLYAMLKQSTKIGPFPMVDGPRGRGPKVDVPFQLVAYIAFGEGAAENAEIGYGLSIFIGYVIQELSRFEKFFR